MTGMTRRIHALASVAGLFLGASAASADSITLHFQNLNPAGDRDTAHTYVTFGGANTALDGTINGGEALVLGKSYPMSSLSKGVTLRKFNSGRIYISYGSGVTANPGNAYNPNFANPSLADYSTRWDKVELDWSGTAGGANLTAQDFFSIPLQLNATGGGVSPTTITWHASPSQVMHQLGLLNGFSVNKSGYPYGAMVVGKAGVTVLGMPGHSVVRVISPATVTPESEGKTVYPSFANYVAFLRNDGKTPIPTLIEGNNGKIGSNLQTYSFTATIRNKAGTVNGTAVQAGDLLFDGTVNNGAGDVPTAFVVRAADLTDYAIYGANAPFTVTKGANTNAIVQKALADYLSGLNFGLVGSTVANPLNPGKSLGASPSWTWYGNNPSGVNQGKLPIKYAFAYAQPVHSSFYNSYASYLTTVSGAYGFAYNDRLQSPLASLGPGSTLIITALSDGVSSGSGNGSGHHGPPSGVYGGSAASWQGGVTRTQPLPGVVDWWLFARPGVTSKPGRMNFQPSVWGIMFRLLNKQ